MPHRVSEEWGAAGRVAGVRRSTGGRILRGLCAGLVLLVSCGCNGRAGSEDTVVLRVGGQTIRVQVVTRRRERFEALWYRSGVPADEGALLAYSEAGAVELPCTGQLVTLQAAALDAAGRVLAIEELGAHQPDPASFPDGTKYILKASPEFFARSGLAVGGRVEIPEALPGMPADPPGMPRTQVRIGENRPTIELAWLRADRQRGLSRRDSLGPDAGMLFLYPRRQILTFWMKDTTIPLDIAFLAEEGEILEIVSMRPLNLNQVRSRAEGRYVLEMNLGWFDAHKVHEGDRVVLNDTILGLAEQADGTGAR